MRIAYVFMHFPAPRETFAATDVLTLAALGADVRAYTLRRKRPEADRLRGEYGLEALPIDQATRGDVLRGLAAALARPGLAAWLVGVLVRDNWRQPVHLAKSLALVPRAFVILTRLERDPPDVVHLFWGHYPSVVGVLVERALPRVVVTTFLGAYDLLVGLRTSARLARTAARVFTHARANLELLKPLGVGADRVTVAYRGVDVAKWGPRAEAGAARKVRHRIASAGALDEGKGFREVVEVFARVRSEWPDATLVLAGDGPQRAELEALVAERGLAGAVSFLGYVEHARVVDELAAAEVLVFLSRFADERLPNVVKEAILARCLCVVSRTTGIEELVLPERGGVLVEARDVATAASAVDAAFRDPARAAVQTAVAHAHLLAHFDVRASMATYLAEWERLVAARRA